MGRRSTPHQLYLAAQRRERIRSLEHKLAETDSQLEQLFVDKSLRWHIRIGKWTITRRISSEAIAVAYAALCGSALVTGVILALVAPTKELGVALVVGAIFGTAAFMAQFWTVAATQQQEILDETYDRSTRQRLRDLAEERDGLIKELAAMDGEGRFYISPDDRLDITPSRISLTQNKEMRTRLEDRDQLRCAIDALENLAKSALVALGKFSRDAAADRSWSYEGFFLSDFPKGIGALHEAGLVELAQEDPAKPLTRYGDRYVLSARGRHLGRILLAPTPQSIEFGPRVETLKKLAQMERWQD